MSAMGPLIELDATAEWEPPDRPGGALAALRARLQPIAAVLIAVLVGTLLTAAGPVGREAALRIGNGVLEVRIFGGRLYLTRWVAGGIHHLEARAMDGALIWGRDLDPNQLLLDATDTEVVLGLQYNVQLSSQRSLTVVDAADGHDLWNRAAVALEGRAATRLVVEDTVTAQRLGLELRTGATAWSAPIAAGTPVAYDGDESGLRSFAELDAGGTLREWDAVTGRLTRTDRLDRTGASGFLLRGDQVVVTGPALTGADFYDRRTGRLQWHHAGLFGALWECTRWHWCAADGGGIQAYDAGTGRPAWRLADYNDFYAETEDTVVVGGLGTSAVPAHEPVVFVLDARTGAVRRRIDGWNPVTASLRTLVLWRRPSPDEPAVFATLDPRTGRIVVLGRGLWSEGGCDSDGRVLACAAVGDLTVWPLPWTARA